MEIKLTQAILVLTVILLVQGIKQSEAVNNKYLPIISIAIGIGLNFLFVSGYNTILFGIFCGVLAAGTFDTIKGAWELVQNIFSMFGEKVNK